MIRWTINSRRCFVSRTIFLVRSPEYRDVEPCWVTIKPLLTTTTTTISGLTTSYERKFVALIVIWRPNCPNEPPLKKVGRLKLLLIWYFIYFIFILILISIYIYLLILFTAPENLPTSSPIFDWPPENPPTL